MNWSQMVTQMDGAPWRVHLFEIIDLAMDLGQEASGRTPGVVYRSQNFCEN
jgi:hypothetical protein